MSISLLHTTERGYECARAADSLQSGSVNIVGVGFDGTACFRKGAAAGPDAIRRVSADIESYSPYLDLDLADDPPFFDLGNLRLAEGDPFAAWSRYQQDFAGLVRASEETEPVRLLVLGGEHSVSQPVISYYLRRYPDLLLLHLDAHADLRDGYEGYPFSHASVIRRCLDHFGPRHRLLQYGIRSGTREEFAWMRANNTLVWKREELLERLAALPAMRPVYLTLDLDFFDPAFLPGTGTPEAGGEDFHCFVAIVQLLITKNLVGVDVVELAPVIDSTGNSDVFAAKVVRELLLALRKGGAHAG